MCESHLTRAVTGKDKDAGKDRRQRGTTDEVVGWHHQLNGCEFEQTLGDGEGQGSLAYYSPWGHRVGHNSVTQQQKLLLERAEVSCVSVRGGDGSGEADSLPAASSRYLETRKNNDSLSKRLIQGGTEELKDPT